MAERLIPEAVASSVWVISAAWRAWISAAARASLRTARRSRWASGATWAALEILTAAVGKVGLDRKAIRDYVAGNEHATIIGKIRFAGSENVGTPGTVSQWQNGEFEVVWPQKVATAKLMPVKPAWK